MPVKIITDSSADLPKELYAQYDIDVIPLRVFDEADTEFFDGETLLSSDLLANMREGTVYKTSLPALEALQQLFTKYAEHNTSCIYLSISSELSGTYQSAVLVRNELQETYTQSDIDIIDTKSVSMGQGLIVLQAAKLAQQGVAKEEILERISTISTHLEQIFTVDDLQYLVRGGRIGRVAGFIGGLLHIKPVLQVEEGKLVPLEKIRGRKKLLQRMIELVAERGNGLDQQTIGIVHGDDLEGATALQNMLTERFGCSAFVVNTIGAAVGAHAGPGALGIFFLNEKEIERL